MQNRTENGQNIVNNNSCWEYRDPPIGVYAASLHGQLCESRLFNILCFHRIVVFMTIM